MRRAAVFLLAVAFSACSAGGGSKAGAARFDTLGRRTSSKPAAPAASPKGALPKNLPPAAMFLGPASWRTGPSRYCLDGECTTLSPPHPPAVEGPAGAAVLFSLSAFPVSARLEVGESSAPDTVTLSPGTSMVWQASLPPGTYPLTLVATYKGSEVAWPFVLRIASEKKKG